MEEKLFLSREMWDVSPKPNIPSSSGIRCIVSNLFPFELKYEACDISTREEIKIGSGIMVHGVIIPELDFKDTSPLMIEEPTEIKIDFIKRYFSNKSFFFTNDGSEDFYGTYL